MKPYLRAAFSMLFAFEPSRETPHSWRSSSRGTIFPWYPRIIASAAAPHSTASIWRTVGHFARRFSILGTGFGPSGGGAGTGFADTSRLRAEGLLHDREDVGDGLLLLDD